MKEVIVEYIERDGIERRQVTFSTGYHENGGAGYDLSSDPLFARLWSPSATTFISRDRIVSLIAVDEAKK